MANIDLVLVDRDLPDMPGIELVQTLLPLHPPLRFALLSGRSAPAVPHDAMALSPRICQVQRHASVADLAQAAARPASGAHRARGQRERRSRRCRESGPRQRERQRRSGLGNNLTQRERQLLALMGLGLSNQQISDRLHIAMPTVKFHVTHILSKMGADNRTEAVLLALRHGLVQLQ